MTVLQHAEAHERLVDLVLEPAALERLIRDLVARDHGGSDPGDDPLGAHVAACPICRADVAASGRLHGTVRAVLAGGADLAVGRSARGVQLSDLAAEEWISAPAELRSAVRDLAATSRSPIRVGADVAGAPRRRWGAPIRVAIARPMGRLLPLVAVLAIALLAGGALVDRAARLDRSRAETVALESVTATVDRVLRDPTHQVMELLDSSGVARGSVSWSRQDLVVLTDALAPPATDQVYRCWIERGGVRYAVGQMWFAGATAYWTGSVDAWAATSFDAGGTFGVSLESAVGDAINPAVLVADLGG
jgi:hypothetical protein